MGCEVQVLVALMRTSEPRWAVLVLSWVLNLDEQGWFRAGSWTQPVSCCLPVGCARPCRDLSASPTCSAAEQLHSGALCEPAWLLIYLLVKEITIAVITGHRQAWG